MYQTGSHSLLTHNGIQVLSNMGIWDKLQPYSHPISNFTLELSQKVTFKPPYQLMGVAVGGVENDSNQWLYSVPYAKLFQLLNSDQAISRRTLERASKDGDEVRVEFNGNFSNNYSSVIVTDHAKNPLIKPNFEKLLGKRNSPIFPSANFNIFSFLFFVVYSTRQAIISTVVQRPPNYSEKTLREHWVHGARFIINPISATKLEVIIHYQLKYPEINNILPVQLDVAPILTNFFGETLAAKRAAIYPIIEQLLEPKKKVTRVVPITFGGKLPRYHDGLVFVGPVKNPNFPFGGLNDGVTLEECFLLAENLKNKPMEEAARAMDSSLERKNAWLTKMTNKVVRDSVFDAKPHGLISRYSIILRYAVLKSFGKIYKKIVKPF